MRQLAADYPDFVGRRFTSRAEGVEGILHAAIGMTGELLELGSSPTRENVVEELGDIEFYRCAAYRVLGLAWTLVDDRATAPGGWVYVYPSFLAGCESFQDQAKKCWVYNRPLLKEPFLTPLWVIDSCLKKAYTIFGLDRAVVIQMNMDKLVKRYPEGYSHELAAERRDKA